MTPAQSFIATAVRRRLGDDAADELVQTWAEDGVDQPRNDDPTPEEFARLVSWRFDPNVQRRRIAVQRLAALGVDVSWSRKRTEAWHRRQAMLAGRRDLRRPAPAPELEGDS